MSRKSAREQAFKLIYCRCLGSECTQTELIQGEDIDKGDPFYIGDLDEDDKDYIARVYGKAIVHFDFLKSVVERFAIGFTFERIFKIDCALIVLAACEILFFDDIPFRVAINEAAELAHKYSTDESAAFINGVLSPVVTQKEELLNELLSMQDN